MDSISEYPVWNSRLYVGRVAHARLKPVHHAFAYPIYYLAVDLDELPLIEKYTRFFGYNRRRIFSIWDKDYLFDSPVSIREKLNLLLEKTGINLEPARVMLLSMARFLNYAFNPVSFFYCYDTSGKLACVVAEVNNTFHEKHLYVLNQLEQGHQDLVAKVDANKAFHVSPFFDRNGKYEFLLSDIREQLDICIDYIQEGEAVLKSRLSGKYLPLSSGGFLKLFLTHPFDTVMTYPRILMQAVKLYYQKKLPVFTKPIANHPLTVRVAGPTWRQRLGMKFIHNLLCRVERGCLRLELPNNEVWEFGRPGTGLDETLKIHDFMFFQRLLVNGDVGFGESYMEGEWDCQDLTSVIKLMVENREYLGQFAMRWAWLGHWNNRVRHWVRRNTIKGSLKNIQGHYDLSNELFATFLDPSMTYSCAYFNHPGESLEEAQQNKLMKIISKAKIEKDHQVLEIGSGWGSLALAMAYKTGCKVTTITLSKNQQDYVQNRVKEAGLDDQIKVLLCDYREVSGHFDRIVSVEMLEAVGYEYLGTFFQSCERLLKKDGLMVVQVITMPDQQFELYRKGTDWIQKYIFHGGLIPSLGSLCNAMRDHSQFFIDDLENIGLHYAETLKRWREKMFDSLDRIYRLGFDHRFVRMMEYYFSYCEAGFATGTLGDLQLFLTRPNNPTLLGKLH